MRKAACAAEGAVCLHAVWTVTQLWRSSVYMMPCQHHYTECKPAHDGRSAAAAAARSSEASQMMAHAAPAAADAHRRGASGALRACGAAQQHGRRDAAGAGAQGRGALHPPRVHQRREHGPGRWVVLMCSMCACVRSWLFLVGLVAGVEGRGSPLQCASGVYVMPEYTQQYAHVQLSSQQRSSTHMICTCCWA
jgi:hypothetical protein